MISFPGLLRWFTSSSLAPVAYFIQLFQVGGSLRLGYPIRLSRDQWLCAPTPGFSQLITAFFALQLQGIHHGPIFRLTILSFPSDFLSLALRFSDQACFVLTRFSEEPSSLFPSLVIFKDHFLVGRDRVELSTPALSERCSNQLSYHPIPCRLTVKGKKEDLFK